MGGDPSDASTTAGRVDVRLDAASTPPAVVVEPDWDWLRAPGRRYPVSIDPTFSLPILNDSFVHEGNPGHNYGLWDNAEFGRPSNNARRRALMRFDLSTLPTIGTVTSATWNGYISTSYSNLTYQMEAVQTAWSGSQVTWNNQPDVRAGAIPATASIGWNAVDITQWVNNWRSGTWANQGVRLSTGDNNTYKQVRTSEWTGAEVPRLDVTLSAPEIAIDDVIAADSLGETSAGFTLTRSGPTDSEAKVDFATSPGSAQTSDFVAQSGTVRFGPGETKQYVNVPIVPDEAAESDEMFTLNLSPTSPPSALITDSTGIGTITSGSPPATIAVGNTQVGPGGPASFIVTRSGETAFTSTVGYQTADGSASAPTDYTSRTGTITFDPGETEEIIDVPLSGSDPGANDKVFSLALSDPTNASLLDGLAFATVVSEFAPAPEPDVEPGLLQWAVEPPEGFGEILDLCDPEDASLVGLETAPDEFAGQLEEFGVACGATDPQDAVRFATLSAGGETILLSPDDIATQGEEAIFIEAASDTVMLPLGGPALGGPVEGPATLTVDEETVDVRDGVVRGLISNDTGQYGRSVVVDVLELGVVVGSANLPMTVQSGEVVPFEVDLGRAVDQADLTFEIEGALSSTPDLERAANVETTVTQWSGPREEYSGIAGAAEDMPPDDTVYYSEVLVTVLTPVGVDVPQEEPVLDVPKVRVAWLDESGRVIEVVDSSLFESQDGTTPSTDLATNEVAAAGLFRPTPDASAIVVAWDAS